jgi:hypothetical protein
MATTDRKRHQLHHQQQTDADRRSPLQQRRTGQPNLAATANRPLPYYLLYRAYSQQTQNLTTRRQLFLHATWQDAIIPHLDLSTMITHIPEDRSRRYWLEMRYHKDFWEVGFQVQSNINEVNPVGIVTPVEIKYLISLKIFN